MIRRLPYFLLLIFISVLFQNCESIKTEDRGTILGNPFQYQTVNLKFSNYSAPISEVDMCLTNVLFRIKHLTAANLNSELVGLPVGGENSGFDVSYFYYDPETDRYFLNGLFLNKLIHLDSMGTDLGKYSVPSGIYDQVIFGFSDCHESRSLSFKNQFGSFQDLPHEFFILKYDGEIEPQLRPSHEFNVAEFADGLKDITSSQNLQTYLEPLRLFDLVGLNFIELSNQRSTKLHSAVDIGNGQTLALGSSLEGSAHNMFIAKYKSNGMLDESFGGPAQPGVVILWTNAGPGAESAIVDDQGNIYVNATQLGPSKTLDVTIFKLRPNGTLDTTFATDGRLFLHSGDRDDWAKDIIRLKNGNLLVASVTRSHKLRFAQITPQGAPVTTFGQSGAVMIPTALLDQSSYKLKITEQSDGKILFATHVNAPVGDDWHIGRLNSNGSIDQSYSSSGDEPGHLFYSFGYNVRALVNDIKLLADQSLIVVGSTNRSNSVRAAAIRIDSTGTVDSNFGSNSVFELDVGISNNAYTITTASTGHFLISGTIQDTMGAGYYIAALRPDGVIDSQSLINGLQVFSTNTTTSGGYLIYRENGPISLSGSGNNAIHQLTLH